MFCVGRDDCNMELLSGILIYVATGIVEHFLQDAYVTKVALRPLTNV